MDTFVKTALLACLALSPAAMSQAPSSDGEFLRLETAWTEAMKAQDGDSIESFLAPDFTLTVAQPTGLVVTDRAAWLRNATTTFKVREFAFKHFAVRRFGDVAVVSSIYTQLATVNGRPRSGDAFLTDVWTRVDGQWKVSARYSSDPKARTAQPPPADASGRAPSSGGTP